MKSLISNLLLILFIASFSGCGSDDNDPKPSSPESLGTFAGFIQVVDDPQTDLGYILDAKVTVTRTGSAATVKIIGNPGFDREYSGNVTSGSGGNYDITLLKQTKPTEKIAGERLVILNNKLAVSIDIANDNVQLRDSPTTTATFSLAGKLSLIGTDMLKE